MVRAGPEVQRVADGPRQIAYLKDQAACAQQVRKRCCLVFDVQSMMNTLGGCCAVNVASSTSSWGFLLGEGCNREQRMLIPHSRVQNPAMSDRIHQSLLTFSTCIGPISGSLSVLQSMRSRQTMVNQDQVLDQSSCLSLEPRMLPLFRPELTRECLGVTATFLACLSEI